MAKKFENLDVWKKSMNFSLLIYKITRKFPENEKFGLISQIQRAAVSVPANIAEGSGRSSNKEFVRFLNISLGSLNEVETFIFLAEKLEYINNNEFKYIKEKTEEVGRLLGGFKKYLNNK